MSETHPRHTRGGLTHPPTVLLLGLLTQISLWFLSADSAAFPLEVRLAGGALVLAGIALNVSATGRFAREGTAVRPGTTPSGLVTSGAFRWSRNPMYLGMAAILLGTAGALESPWALVVVPVYVVWINKLIRYEEGLLEATFAESYRAYRRRVRRWL